MQYKRDGIKSNIRIQESSDIKRTEFVLSELLICKLALPQIILSSKERNTNPITKNIEKA